MDLDGALDAAAAIGPRDVELWLGHLGAGGEAVRDACAARHLRPVALSAGRLAAVDETGCALVARLAEALEVGRVVACVPPGTLAQLRRRLPAAVTIAVENHWYHPLATPRELLREVGCVENASVCMDTGHALAAGWTADRFAAELGGRLGHVHLKDADVAARWQRVLGRRLRRQYLPHPRPVWPGEGSLEPSRLAACLERAGYDGFIALEYEGSAAAGGLAALAELASPLCRR